MLTRNQTDSVIALLEKAGAEIKRIYSGDDFHIRIKEDDSPVTKADLAADSIIKSGLRQISPGIPVFSEETKDVPWSERSGWNILWILDPLDGTKEFIARSDEFCISLALIRDHIPVAGFIHAPVTRETWVAETGKGAYRLSNGLRSPMPLIQSEGPYRVNISRTHHTITEEEWISNFMKENEIKIEIYGSAIKFCKIAEGYSDLYPKLSLIHEWDIAAGHLIIEESGGRIIEPHSGRPPLYNKEDYHQPPFIAFGQRVKDWQRWVR
jgi:3'(2'), 5'-bisphosphate nucleotidase